MRLLAIIAFVFSLNINAQDMRDDYKCSEWTVRASVTCIYAGSRASSWERQCENPCWFNPRTRQGNWGPQCDQEAFCHTNVDPNTLERECTQWTKHRGVTCRNPSTGDWEQKWVRKCTIGLKESWCSGEYPTL